MKTLADASFFRAFDRVVAAGNPGLKRAQWTFAEVDWLRERHSFTGADHGFSVEVFRLTRGGRSTWTLLLVKEHWWGGPKKDAVKQLQWARPLAGRGADVLVWLRERERLLDP